MFSYKHGRLDLCRWEKYLCFVIRQVTRGRGGVLIQQVAEFFFSVPLVSRKGQPEAARDRSPTLFLTGKVKSTYLEPAPLVRLWTALLLFVQREE